ncbi:MAG: hypothetical protein IPJ13_03695 [Saprospiraceae bacterium]|nr:hypothetical protein [Saprospiraceae bacterium]
MSEIGCLSGCKEGCMHNLWSLFYIFKKKIIIFTTAIEINNVGAFQDFGLRLFATTNELL